MCERDSQGCPLDTSVHPFPSRWWVCYQNSLFCALCINTQVGGRLATKGAGFALAVLNPATVSAPHMRFTSSLLCLAKGLASTSIQSDMEASREEPRSSRRLDWGDGQTSERGPLVCLPSSFFLGGSAPCRLMQSLVVASRFKQPTPHPLTNGRLATKGAGFALAVLNPATVSAPHMSFTF